MNTRCQIDSARTMLEDAQEHMREAIEALSHYVALTGDRHTEAYILDHLRIMTSSDHGFMSRDANVGDLIASLDDHEIDDEDEYEYDGDPADDELAHEAFRLAHC